MFSGRSSAADVTISNKEMSEIQLNEKHHAFLVIKLDVLLTDARSLMFARTFVVSDLSVLTRSEARFISSLQPDLSVGTLTRWKSEYMHRSRWENSTPGRHLLTFLHSALYCQLTVFLSLSFFYSHFKAVKEEPICLTQCKYEPQHCNTPQWEI